MKELQTKQKYITETLRLHTELSSLGLGLSSEVGEVNDLIAKLSGLKHPKPSDNTDNMPHQLAMECADVLVYLLQIANIMNIDLAAAYHEKTEIIMDRFKDRINKV